MRSVSVARPEASSPDVLSGCPGGGFQVQFPSFQMKNQSNAVRHRAHSALVLAIGLGAGVLAAQAQISSPGITEPFQDVVLGTPVAGAVEKVHVKEGDFVKAGQVLLELQKRQEELELSRRKLLMEGKAELESAKARVETLKVDVASTRALATTTKSISKDELMKRELELKQAETEVDRLNTVEEREVIELEMAREIVAERSLASPLAGYVVDLLRDVGEDCKAQEPVIRVVDTRQFFFVSNLEARIGYNLKVGQELPVEVEAGKDVIKLTGKISFVSPVVDPASGLLRVKVLCQNAEGRVKPGVAGKMLVPEN